MPPLQLQLVLAWKKDWTGIRDPSAVAARRAYLRGRDPADIALLSNYVREARIGRVDLMRELASPLADELHMVSDVECESNPLDLIDLVDIPGDDRLIVQQRFEALSLADLAVAMYELEKRDSMDRVEQDLRAMITLLERRVFSGETRELDIYTYHDPDDLYRVRQVSYDAPADHPGLVERKHNSRSRIMRDGKAARFDARPKDRFRTILKLVRQIGSPKPGQDPYLVKDRCRFTFAVEDVDSARSVAEEIRWYLVASGADVVDDGDNLTEETGVAADATNPRSSPRYRKKQLAVRWHGRWYEFQIVTFAGYYGALYTLDEENHAIYKTRQGVSDLLPMLYPASIYLEEGTWNNASLVKLLHDRQIERLGWNHRRHNGKH